MKKENTNLPEDIISVEAETPCEDGCTEAKIENTEVCELSNDAAFSKHMSEYIGKTVTVYTTSGGPAGGGMAGVLLDCTDSHIRLVTHIGPAPEKPTRKTCRNCPYYKSCLEYAERIQSVGAVAEIPLSSIVMFVHNSL